MITADGTVMVTTASVRDKNRRVTCVNTPADKTTRITARMSGRDKTL